VSNESVAELQAVWKLDCRLATRIHAVFRDWLLQTGIPIEVLSGFRTDAEQIFLARAGRPAASVQVSTHTVCPATGTDVRISGIVTVDMKARFGTIAIQNGLRWGGGGPVDPITGIPLDWNHVDLGPRR